MATNYSTKPIFHRRGKSGFHHSFYIMYHATDAANIEPILRDGFRPSTGGTLGAGIYCSLTMDKASDYGNTIFRLLVYPGKTFNATSGSQHSSWQDEFSSAWIPPSTSTLEENCIRSGNQIRILGIAEGWANLSSQVQAMTINCEGATSNQLSGPEKKVLGRMRREVGESWTMIQAPGKSDLVLDVSARDESIILWTRPKMGEKSKDNQLFKVWHDFTIRSKLNQKKKICMKKDKTLCISNDDTDLNNQFTVQPYEGGAIKNGANVYISAKDLKKGGKVVAVGAKPQTWWFTK